MTSHEPFDLTITAEISKAEKLFKILSSKFNSFSVRGKPVSQRIFIYVLKLFFDVSFVCIRELRRYIRTH